LVRDAAGNLFGTTGEGGLHNYGTVFKVTPAGTETLLHVFAGGVTDGASPFGGLTLDAAGNLYGTTVLGGAYNAGTIFKLSSAGVETLLYSFGAFPGDGQQPHAGLLRDVGGNLYGTAREGGESGLGAAFKLSPIGGERILYNFAGSPTDGQYPHSVPVEGSTGKIYGTTLEGGSLGQGAIFELSPGGKEILLHSFTGSPGDGKRPHAGLTRDRAGNLYGTTLQGGAFGFGTIFELNSSGTEALLHSFANTATDGGMPENGVLLDGARNLYGTTSVGGASGCGTVFEYSP